MKSGWMAVALMVLFLGACGNDRDSRREDDLALDERGAEISENDPAAPADELADRDNEGSGGDANVAAPDNRDPYSDRRDREPGRMDDQADRDRSSGGNTPRSEPPPSQPAIRQVAIEPGTELQATFDEEISTKTHAAGRSVSATLQQPYARNGLVVVPTGSKLRGQVTQAERAGRVGGRAHLSIEFTELTTPGGASYPIGAQPLVMEGKSTGSGDLQKVVGGAVGGAILGGVLGGKKGAVKGGAAGGAAGSVWAATTRGNDIVLEAGTPVIATLNREVSVPVEVPPGSALP